jgi:hypothetical protein
MVSAGRLTATTGRWIALRFETGGFFETRSLAIFVLVLVSRAAHAHGGDVLTSIYSEIISIALCLAFLFLRKEAKPYRAIGFTASVIGVVSANWALADVLYSCPVSKNNYGSGGIVPLLATVSAIYISKFIANHKK